MEHVLTRIPLSTSVSALLDTLAQNVNKVLHSLKADPTDFRNERELSCNHAYLERELSRITYLHFKTLLNCFLIPYNLSPDIDECAQFNPCKNGASCINHPGGFKCVCPVGVTGMLCDSGTIQ